MSTATNGRAREYRVRDDLATHGWQLVMRSAGSKGCADLAMVHPDHGLALVQVGTASKSLGPADRERFLNLAYLCSALAVVAITGRTGIRYYTLTAGPASTWPAWDPEAVGA